MKLTPSQRLMADDGAPSVCFATPAQRAAWWKANPPAAMPAFQLQVRNPDAATVEFAAQEAERRRLKSLAGIARMKNRIAAKKVDLTKCRWDPRRNRFVEDNMSNSSHDRDRGVVHTPPHPKEKQSFSPTRHRVEGDQKLRDNQVLNTDWSRVTKDSARTLAELNGIWDDKYEKLSGGLLVMTVTNRLKGLVKKGGAVRWN